MPYVLLKTGVKAEFKLFELNLLGRTISCFPWVPLPSLRLYIEFKCLAVLDEQLIGLRLPWIIELTHSLELAKLCRLYAGSLAVSKCG